MIVAMVVRMMSVEIISVLRFKKTVTGSFMSA